MTVLTLWRRGRGRPATAASGGSDERRTFREAFVFSGGGSLGALQVGALRALLEAGVAPDLVVGCSVGALNAAHLAVDPRLERVELLERIWLGLSRDDVFPDRRVDVARRLVGRREHLYSPEALQGLVDRWVPLRDLADTEIPCHVVTTDLLAGGPCWWTSGSPIDILTASACLPAVFPPVRIDGGLHVDGAVTCPVPVQRALDVGAERVWVLDVSSEFHPWSGDRMTALDVLLESFAVTRSHLARQAPVVGPDQRVVWLRDFGVGRHDLRDFSAGAELVAAGFAAAREVVAAELAAAVPAS